MDLTTPQPNDEAAASIARRRVMPTELSTAELQELDASVRSQSFFSARTMLEDLLEQYRDEVASIVNPEQTTRADRVTEDNPEGFVNTGLNPAKARELIKDLLARMGYYPEEDKRGTLQDLSSDARINLVLRTNVQMAQGEGWWLQSQQPALLDEWPAQELFRAEDREKKRAWLQRWQIAGLDTGDPIGTGWTITPDERMIALKNHPIWDELGSSDNFDDALDQPWPPFAFNSGMWVRDVDRAEAQVLGLIAAGETVQPRSLADVFKEAA